MRGKQDRPVLSQTGHELTEAHALFRVEPDRGLVDDQHLGLVHEGLRHSEPAHHAAGELLDLAVRDGFQSHHREDFRDAATPLPAPDQSRHAGESVDHFLGPVKAPGSEFLRQVADEGPYLQGFTRDVVPAHRHGAPGRYQQGSDDSQEGALAGAVRSEKAEQAGAQGEVHILKGGVSALVGVADTTGVDG